ncbi:SRPBCC family protein [Archangium violaceum]|uniref:SRPBCC family protein n=1 Tax=Archangium violaceum TaxID=83451 RepID=UPI002B29C225|nr:SRPBCC family protein [Archangium gephyra]
MAKDDTVRHLRIGIARPLDAVYAFVSNPMNLPRWAKGLGGSVVRDGEQWLVQTPQGPARLRFAPPNPFGVLDHYVSPAPGIEVYVPLRVIAHGTASEVVFTLFRQPGMTDAQFAQDAAMVEQDLAALKALLEA